MVGWLMLPRLRGDLDIMPSPVEDRPGLLLRDSLRYSDAVLIIPPDLVQCLACFDGEKTSRDLHEMLYRMSGDLRAGEWAISSWPPWPKAAFLKTKLSCSLRDARHREFAECAGSRARRTPARPIPTIRWNCVSTMRRWMPDEADLSS